MTEEEILKRLQALSDATAEKTADGSSIDVSADISPKGRIVVWVVDANEFDIPVMYFGDDFEGAIARAEAAVAALPDAKTLRREKVQRDLAKLIEDCAAADIDTSFVNPLREMAKKLSENAITCEAAQ